MVNAINYNRFKWSADKGQIKDKLALKESSKIIEEIFLDELVYEVFNKQLKNNWRKKEIKSIIAEEKGFDQLIEELCDPRNCAYAEKEKKNIVTKFRNADILSVSSLKNGLFALELEEITRNEKERIKYAKYRFTTDMVAGSLKLAGETATHLVQNIMIPGEIFGMTKSKDHLSSIILSSHSN